MNRLLELFALTPRPLATLMVCLTVAIGCLAVAQVLRMPRNWQATLDDWPISPETNLLAFCLLIGWSAFGLPALEMGAVAVVVGLGEVGGRRAATRGADLAPASMMLFMLMTAGLGALAAPAAMAAALPAIKQATFMTALPFDWASPLQLGVAAVVRGLAAAELCISLLMLQVVMCAIALCGWRGRRLARTEASALLAQDHEQGAVAAVHQKENVRA